MYVHIIGYLISTGVVRSDVNSYGDSSWDSPTAEFFGGPSATATGGICHGSNLQVLTPAAVLRSRCRLPPVTLRAPKCLRGGWVDGSRVNHRADLAGKLKEDGWVYPKPPILSLDLITPFSQRTCTPPVEEARFVRKCT